MFKVSPVLRAKVRAPVQRTDVKYVAPINTTKFLNLRKMASRWEFIKPIYQNVKRGDTVYVRYFTDYEYCQRFEGIVTQIRRSNYSSSMVLLNPQSGISQRMFFFAPTLLFAEIKAPTSDDLMWYFGKQKPPKRSKIAPTSPPKFPQVPPKWYKPEEAIIKAGQQKSSSSTQAEQQQ